MKLCEMCTKKRRQVYFVSQPPLEVKKICFDCFMSENFWKWYEVNAKQKIST